MKCKIEAKTCRRGYPSGTFCGAPSGARFQRVKVPNPPGSGKDIAKTKGVHCEVESEGRWRQISGLTNRNHIRLQLRIRLRPKPKSNNYSELTVVDVADRWRERNVWYLGRSRQQMETE